MTQRAFEIAEYKPTREDGSLPGDKVKSIFCFKIVWLRKSTNPNSRFFGKNMFTFMWSFDLPDERENYSQNAKLSDDWRDYQGLLRLDQYAQKHQSEIKEIVIFRNHNNKPLGYIYINSLPPIERKPASEDEKPREKSKPRNKSEPRQAKEPKDPELLYSEMLSMLEMNKDFKHIPHEELKKMARMYFDEPAKYKQLLKEIYANLDVAPS